MDVHKPKPVHSFREFLSEIAVVVVGIAIALAGEQFIEHLHNSRKASEAREGIRDEIAINLAVLGTRREIQRCVDQRIDEVAHLIDASADPGYVAPTWLGRPQNWEMLHARWQVVSQAGQAPLLAPDEQAGYGFIYAVLADVAADEDREQGDWARLRVLEGLARPSAEMRDTLRLALQDVRYANWDIKGLSELWESKATEMALAKRPAGRVQTSSGICFATDTPRAEALKRLSTDAHYPVEQP
jgi:hypothetical protein